MDVRTLVMHVRALITDSASLILDRRSLDETSVSRSAGKGIFALQRGHGVRFFTQRTQRVTAGEAALKAVRAGPWKAAEGAGDVPQHAPEADCGTVAPAGGLGRAGKTKAGGCERDAHQ